MLRDMEALLIELFESALREHRESDTGKRVMTNDTWEKKSSKCQTQHEQEIAVFGTEMQKLR